MEGAFSQQEAYSVLGLSPGASEEEVRRAYKRLALKHHPDKSTDPDAKAKFQRVHAAYKRITDPDAFNDEGAFSFEEMYEMFEEMLHGTFMGMPFACDDELFGACYGFDDEDFGDDEEEDCFVELMAEMGIHDPILIEQVRDQLLRQVAAGFLSEDEEEEEKEAEASDGSDGSDEVRSTATCEAFDEVDRSASTAAKPVSLEGQAGNAPASPSASPAASDATPLKAAKSRPRQVFELGPRQPADGGYAPCCGARVLVRGSLPGRVAYAGPVHYAAGDFFGVVLDEPKGKNNGTVRGMQYFSCPPKHGLMVKASELRPLSEASSK